MMPGHNARVWCADRDRDFYTWECECGIRGARDFVHREYARDDAREAHGLAPLIGRPLV